MKLYYFTSSYPYGIGEQWKQNELNVLRHHFDSITVIPYSYDGNFDSPKPLPAGIQLQGPLFNNNGVQGSKKDLLRIIRHPKRWQFLQEFFSRKAYSNKSRLVSWFSATLNVMRLLDHPVIKEVLKKADHETVFYFFWGKGSCEFMPFVNIQNVHKSFVRMHRYDLFEYENDNYIPYRKALLNSITIAAPSSIAGQRHLKELYPDVSAAIEVFRCGTIGIDRVSKASDDKVLRIVSCSMLSPVKRVHLMIESLQYLKIPVLWRHVGDGKLRKDLEELATKLNVRDRFVFEGMMDSRKVLNFYADNTFDVFINVSASEGVPFSIMEAFSAGIPVMATNVGGSGEIVDEGAGMLLPENITATDLAESITLFYSYSIEHRNKLREEACRRYKEQWNAETLAGQLAVYLKS